MIARMPIGTFGKSRKIATACASGVLALLATTSPVRAGEDDYGLDGVWRVTRHGVDCNSGTQFSTFPAIMQFGKGGLLTGYAVPPGSSPALQSPEYGTWKRAPGTSSYAFRFVSYNYDLSGTFVGQINVAGDLKLSGDGQELSYTAIIKFLDAAGQLQFQRCGAATGKRY